MKNYLPLLIILVIATVIILLLFALIHRIRCTARQWSDSLFGTDSLREGMKRQKNQIAETPKSVSGMTKLCLPQIQRDFPAFHYEEFRQLAQNTLKGILTAISKQDTSVLEHVSEELAKQVELKIEDDIRRGEQEHFEDIAIHQTEIARYRKEAGRCIIVFQSAVGYLHYITGDKGLISGSEEQKEQVKYNMELLYVQDISKTKYARQDKALGLTCPNCGAPVITLGSKYCDYCGSGIVELNLYVWQFDRYEKL